MKKYTYRNDGYHIWLDNDDALQDGDALYLASDVTVLESAAADQALRIKELEKLLREVIDAFYDVDAREAGKERMADAIDDASKSLMEE